MILDQVEQQHQIAMDNVQVNVVCNVCVRACVCMCAVLEITIDHWSFSNQFQHLADQNPFWLANFTVHFQWDGNQ